MFWEPCTHADRPTNRHPSSDEKKAARNRRNLAPSFGSRSALGGPFVKIRCGFWAGGVIDYPKHKLILNRVFNSFIRLLFHHGFTDITTAFKAYRKTTTDGANH
jgi:hypothetical protein